MNGLVVPITKFHKGKAHSIFKDVAKNGAMVVTKFKEPVCVLVSPSMYDAIIETLEDFELYVIAVERQEKANPKVVFSQKEIMEEFGITAEDLDNIDVDIN